MIRVFPIGDVHWLEVYCDAPGCTANSAPVRNDAAVQTDPLVRSVGFTVVSTVGEIQRHFCPRHATGGAQAAPEKESRMAAKKKDSNGTDRTGMVQVDLTDEQLAERGALLATEELKLKELKEKKRTHNRKWNEELKQLTTRVEELAEEIDSEQAWVEAQHQLRGVDTAPPKPKRDRKGQGKAFAKKAQAAADAAGGE